MSDYNEVEARPTEDQTSYSIGWNDGYDAAAAQNNQPRKEIEVTTVMVDRALTAWFASPPSETDQGLERSMRAALEAALR